MKLFIVGDFYGNTGPANVNKAIKIKEKEIITSKCKWKLTRVLEVIFKGSKAECIIFSGFSKLNLVALKIAKLMRKKTGYLMHGSVEIEGRINGDFNLDKVELEKKIIKKADKVICVSKLFRNIMREEYPKFKEKFYYVNNPINFEIFNRKEDQKRDKDLIMSVGGGVPRKNILILCKVIEDINREKNKNYKLLVIGGRGKDTEKIQKYKFVKYIENVSFDKMEKYYRKSNLYIQNSSFETFGLAPIEAYLCGTNILISQNVGCKDVFVNLNEDKIIYNCKNEFEIKEKIERNMNIEFNEKIKLDKSYLNYGIKSRLIDLFTDKI